MMKDKQRSINPYLTFAGNCEKAMNFYKEVFNGQLELMRFEGSPVEVPDAFKQNILHATLTFGHAMIMASDDMQGNEMKAGNNISISVSEYDSEKAKKIFENLSTEGFVIMPYEKTFWGAEFGMCTDKFGINWMVNCELEG